MGLLLSAAGACAAEAGSMSQGLSVTPGSAFMRVYGRSEPPSGWVRLCQSEPSICAGDRGAASRVELDSLRWRDLIEVNAVVNRTVKPVSDLELFGTSEVWTVAHRSGDCEDFALLKRQLLIERGWPVGALLMTVVRDEAGAGHAILTARTSKGDYVLDNRIDKVSLWSEVPYSYVKRQSYLSPTIWMALDPAATQPSVEVSTSR
jgi:predicted transglutaminase-like cysteine proteinase